MIQCLTIMEAMQIIIKICSVLGTIITVLISYQAIFFIVGLFKTRKFKKTDNFHKYGICIAARNEEKVIKNILDSIANQDYPLDKLCVFVVADNCTDHTAEIVKNYENNDLKIVLYEHHNPEERTKGYALRFLFDKIKSDFGIEAFDGYFIFDADNVMQSDYFSRMNEAFDEGNKIITSFRNSKNMHQNWISFSYAVHWMRTYNI